MYLSRVGVLLVALLLIAACAKSDVIYNIQFSPKPVAAMQFNQNVTITFDYRTNQAAGVLIFARPMSSGALTPYYAAHGSPLYPQGSGSGSGFFTVTGGAATVDAVRFRITTADQSQILLEFFVPVRYYYAAHAIYDIALAPESPSGVQLNQDVTVEFKYRTSEAGGVRIFPRPMTGASTTPNYGASGSPLYATGSGSGTGHFTIMAGTAKVDGVRFQMFNDAQTSMLLEFVVPVDYAYAAHSITNIHCTPAPPEGLVLNSEVNISFDYRTAQPGGVLIFPRPFTDGGLSPMYAASGSPNYPTGSGSGSGSFTISTGEVTVDSVRFRMMSLDQGQTLLEYFVPVNFHFAAHKITGIQYSPSSPAYFTYEEYDTSRFDYTTTQPGGVVIFPRPYSNGTATPNYGASPSPIYATGSGTGTGWFHIIAGNALVDQMRFQMQNAAQTQTLVTWFYPVHFQYGSMTLVGVADEDFAESQTYALWQNYPNPFNPSSDIRYQVPGSGNVRLAVYDLLGREVAVLVNEMKPAGSYGVRFDASGLASGMYLYRLTAGSFVATRKMIVLR